MKAIETIYHGYRFRSRLEARWAVFFDQLGIPYQYEPEGFDLDEAGWYLPDFWLPELHCWVEIKPWPPNEDNNDVHKCLNLSRATQCRVLLIYGNPWLDDYYIAHYKGGKLTGCFMYFALCRKCDTELWLSSDTSWDDLALNNDPSCQTDEGLSSDAPRLIAAYTAARQARFEHGEYGKRPEVSRHAPPHQQVVAESMGYGFCATPRLPYVGKQRDIFVTHVWKTCGNCKQKIPPGDFYVEAWPPSGQGKKPHCTTCCPLREVKITNPAYEQTDIAKFGMVEKPPPYHPGDKVIHFVFGQGVVLTSEMRYGDEYVEVQFQDSRKRLNTTFARLEKQSN